jgi:hypothetical protein
MSKILKIVAVVASIAAAIPTGGGSLLGLGISSAAFGAIAIGATIGASLLAKRPKAPKAPAGSVDRLSASIDPRTPRKAVFGVTAGRASIR